jgi:hypothetical protein
MVSGKDTDMSKEGLYNENSQIQYDIKKGYNLNLGSIARNTTTFDASPQNCSVVDAAS